MKFRNMAGAFVFWCLLGCLFAGHLQAVSTDESPVGEEFVQLSDPGSITPEDFCGSLCGECQCRGLLVRENLCQCSCDFPPDSAGGQNCTSQVRRLCEQMDVQCEFNGPEEDYVREPRGCHSMSCYEKHHEHGAGDYDGEGYGGDEGYEHRGKHLICCKDKKYKEKKHKHKKHKKFHDKHMKFHVVIKGKIPEPSCHGDHEGGEHYGGYDEQEGYRAAMPDQHPIGPPAHAPMDVTVWTNRQKLPKKFPFRKPFQHHQKPSPHYAPVYPAPYPVEPRGKSAEPRPQPRPNPMHSPQDTQPPPSEQAPSAPSPSPAEPISPPVTPFPEHPLTPPPNLYDGAPIGPKKSPQKPKQEPPKTHSFSPPSPPPPPPPPPSHFVRPLPPMITVDPPTRRFESSRSFEKPSYSSCQFDSYDFNYYHPPPTYHQPAPPPTYYRTPAPTVSSYRSYSSSYDPSYSSSHYHPHDEYDNPKHYSAYDEPDEYSTYDDSSSHSSEYYDGHGVHPFSDNEIEDWPEYPPRHPSEIFTFNQIVSRQIIEANTARLYRTKPFQPTPRPLRDEFEPPTAEVGPILYESFGPADKNYEMYPTLTPPPDAFIPPVPPASPPVEFPEAENRPPTFALNSEEARYPQPTPPPHYLLAKETGSMSSFGFEEYESGPAYHEPTSWSGYGRSASDQSHYRSAPSRSSSHSYIRYH